MSWSQMFAYVGIGVLFTTICAVGMYLAQKHLPQMVARTIAFALIALGILVMGIGIGVWLGI